MDTAYLKSNITAPVSNTKYGKMGDKVTIIAVHDNIATVYKEEGLRFPVLVVELVQQCEPVQEIQAPIEPVKVVQVKRAGRTITKQPGLLF